MTKTNEIKEFLNSGKSVKELLALGYTKALVYKTKKTLKDIKSVGVQTDTKKGEEQDTKTLQDNRGSEGVEGAEQGTDGSQDNQGAEVLERVEEGSEESEEDIDVDLSGIEEETFGDEENSFREISNFSISRDNVELNSNFIDTVKGKPEDGKTGTGKLIKLNELLAEVFKTIGIVTGHEFWDLSTKDQKIIQHLCRIPALEKFLVKFGLYGCALGLFTIVFKRIRLEIQIRKVAEEDETAAGGTQKTEINEGVRYGSNTIMDVVE